VARRSSYPRARPRRPRAVRRPAEGRRVHLRWAVAGDLGTLVRHRRRMWTEIRDYSSAELDRHGATYRRWARERLAAGTFVAVLAETSDGAAVGSGAVWLMPMQPRPGPLGRPEMPYVLSMYTEPRYRGRGIASRIVRELLRWSRARGYGRIFLHASAAGRSVYARLGFRAGSEMRRALRPRASRGGR